MPRLRFCLDTLQGRGYQVVLGSCLEGAGVASGTAQVRAHELMTMLTDDSIQAVVPPWGGELAVELLPRLDFDVLAAAEPTWFVGFSDISTLLLTVRRVATSRPRAGQPARRGPARRWLHRDHLGARWHRDAPPRRGHHAAYLRGPVLRLKAALV
jgi:muramoyltetrapeptide carboxypeptidase